MANTRIYISIIFSLAAISMAYTSIKELYYSKILNEYYSHIILIPIICAYFIYDSRKSISRNSQFHFTAGLPVMIVASLLFSAGRSMTYLNQNDLMSLNILSAVIFLNGSFIMAFGMKAYKSALFPLMFFLLAVPIPTAIMDGIITMLQVGSTEITEMLFMVTGTSYVREGFVFHLPGQSIEVAKQCSGIRSSIALFITGVLAGHMFLRSWWKIVFLVLLTIPVAIFKNAIRITTLTLLSIYVDPRIIQSSLHREGGIPFFILGLCLLAPVLLWLRKSDIKAGKLVVTEQADKEGILYGVKRLLKKITSPCTPSRGGQ